VLVLFFQTEIVVHEIGHAIGLYHEQMRADRDDYVTINYQNIKPGFNSEFEKLPKTGYNDYGKPYDYESIMHYGKTVWLARLNRFIIHIYW
jgi:astacin